MKLTTDMHFALQDALTGCGDGVQCREAIFLAGYRIGQRDMRERAAKTLEAKRDTYEHDRWAIAFHEAVIAIRSILVEES